VDRLRGWSTVLESDLVRGIIRFRDWIYEVRDCLIMCGVGPPTSSNTIQYV
jgi:hypothetical protein